MTRLTIRLLLALPALLLMAAAAPAPASAADRDEIIKDCADDGRLQGSYTPSELRDARKNLPSDVAEYTDCADVLRRAELSEGGTSGGSGGGGSLPGGGTTGGGGGEILTPSTEAERESLAEVASGAPAPVELNGETIVPGAAGFAPNATRNGMPATLLFALIALGLVGLAGLAYALRDKLPSIGPFGRSA